MSNYGLIDRRDYNVRSSKLSPLELSSHSCSCFSRLAPFPLLKKNQTNIQTNTKKTKTKLSTYENKTVNKSLKDKITNNFTKTK